MIVQVVKKNVKKLRAARIRGHVRRIHVTGSNFRRFFEKKYFEMTSHDCIKRNRSSD